MSKIKIGGLDQYSAGPFEQQQFGTAGVECVSKRLIVSSIRMYICLSIIAATPMAVLYPICEV